MPKITMEPYVSLDVETTGVNPDSCQIIEIGAVIDTLDRPLADCATFHCFVRHKLYVGEPFALALHTRIFDILDKNESKAIKCVDDVAPELHSWLKKNGMNPDDKPISFMGKNFGKLDYAFLRRLPMFEQFIKYYHSFYDVGSMYFDPRKHNRCPSTERLFELTGLKRGPKHEALADAYDVARLFRHRWDIPE